MAPDGQDFRAINALRILPREKSYTIDKVIATGYNTYLSAFEVLIPSLVKAYETLTEGDSLKVILQEPVSILKKWDYHSGENSVATTLAVYWGEKILRPIYFTTVPEADENDQVIKTKKFAATATAPQLLQPLLAAITELKNNFGTWNIEWGKINRYQRITGDIQSKFNDDSVSLADGFTSSTWGEIPSFASHTFNGTKKRYGYNGNSFICAVEFGKRIKAKSLLTGGESGNPKSSHFFDQGKMYTNGIFKDVLFYKEDVLKHVERKYHPGK